MEYDRVLFVEIIESLQGIQFIRDDNSRPPMKAKLYEGRNGRLVIIEMSDESIDEYEGKGILIKLGAADLIPAMFP